ncbi:MAG TPA: choice-of-anchor tandem repeat GloVer-containing protein [Candidatus Sulfotelmatobacter sp.]
MFTRLFSPLVPAAMSSFRNHAGQFVASILLTISCLIAPLALPAQTYTDLHDFNASAGDPTGFSNGNVKLAQGRDGDFYGESSAGGTSSQGTVFKVTPSGTPSIVLSFDGTNGSGSSNGGMTLGTDGNLYGDTYQGGTSNLGLTFKVTPAGVETALHNFTNTGDGHGPQLALVLGTNGDFYGATDSNPSTIYQVTSSGVFKTLATLTTAQGYQGAQLSQGSDGDFYGGMNLGGANGFGTLFKMTAAGKITVLHNFTGADGTDPSTGMVAGSNGEFYGSGQMGGASSAGVIFKVTTSGTYTLLHSLNGTSDGSEPQVLMLATDGNFYGTAINAGSASCGTIFKVTLAGAFSVVYNFDNTHGCNPASYLTEGTDGLLYGVTGAGGANGNGVFYSLDVGLSPFITLQSVSGKAGSTVGILGQGFDSSSVVKFNGTAATKVTLTGTTYITATVPPGANTGLVTVTTGATTLTSTHTYLVHNSWASGTAMPVGTVFSSAAVLSKNIYVIGGDDATGTELSDVQIYNPTTNAWSTGTPLPSAIDNTSAAVVNNILYVFGGSPSGEPPTNAVWAYSPKTKTWTSKAPMPTARNGTLALVEKNIVYVMGGNLGGGNFISTVESYDPATNTWKTEASMDGAKDFPGGGLIGTTLVVADGAPAGSVVTGDTEGYDAATNVWSELAVDPTARTGPCSGAIGSTFYDVSGYINNAGAATTVSESFSLATKKWVTLLPIPQGTMFAAAAVVNGQLYCFGGWAVVNSTAINNVQIYQP